MIAVSNEISLNARYDVQLIYSLAAPTHSGRSGQISRMGEKIHIENYLLMNKIDGFSNKKAISFRISELFKLKLAFFSFYFFFLFCLVVVNLTKWILCDAASLFNGVRRERTNGKSLITQQPSEMRTSKAQTVSC